MREWIGKMILGREPFSPSLINLESYEKALLYRREHGEPPFPVMPYPDNRSWTDSELQCMRDNRKEAHAILVRIFPQEAE